MPSGFQTFGPDGAVWLDTNDRVGRVQGVATGVGNNAQINTGMGGQGTPFALVPQPTFSGWSDNNGNSYSAPLVSALSFNGDGSVLTVGFSMAQTSNPSERVYWGNY